MAKIYTTLHPEGLPDDELYPNIEKQNIPNKSINLNKLDIDVIKKIDDADNNLQEQINNLTSGSPSFVDTSANILASTSNKGLAVATDTGYWYYWNGSNYVSSNKVYQATGIGANSVTYNNLDNNLKFKVDNIGKNSESINELCYTNTEKTSTLITTDINSGAYVLSYDRTEIYETSDASFIRTSLFVNPGEKYKITFRSTSVITGIIFVDDLNNIINYLFDKTASETHNNYLLTIPSNVSKMYISSGASVPIVINKITNYSLKESISNFEKQIYTNFILVKKDGTGDYTKVSDAILNATSNTYIYVDDGVYNLIDELGNNYFENYVFDGTPASYGLPMPNNSKLKMSSGAKIVCNYNGSNVSIKTNWSPIMSYIGNVCFEDVTIEASNVKYCIHDEHGGDTGSYTVLFNRCNLYLDDSDNQYAYSKSCIGGGFGKFGTVDVSNCYINSVGEPLDQWAGAVSYHTATNIDDANCKINIYNNYFEGTNTARVYSAYTGSGTQVTFALINNNSLGKSFSTDSKITRKVFLNEIRI